MPYLIQLPIPRLHLLFWLALSLLTIASTSQAADIAQRMRLPIGEYIIVGGGGGAGGGGGGVGGPNGGSSAAGSSAKAGVGFGGGGSGINSAAAASSSGGSGPVGVGSLPLITLPKSNDGSGYKLPAYCIDEGRDPPSSTTALSHVSGSVVVQQYLGQEYKGQKSLNDAISGPDAWLTMVGLSAANEINIKPTNAAYSYRISVSDLAIAGETRADVQSVHQAWTQNAVLMEASKSYDALRTDLLRLPDIEAARLGWLEAQRQRMEWRTFGTASSGAEIPEVKDTPAASTWIDDQIARDFDIEPDNLTAKDRLDWITLLRGRPLEAVDFQFFSEHLAKNGISQSYDGAIGDAALLRAFSLATVLSRQETRILPLLHHLRAERSSDFNNAMRQAAFEVGGEGMWTAGQPEIVALKSLACPVPFALDTSKKAELDHALERRDAEVVAQLNADTSLMKYLNGYAGHSLEPSLVTVSLGLESACFARFDGIKGVERRQIPLSSLTQSSLDPYKGMRFIAANIFAAAALSELGIASTSFGDAERELSLKAFTKRENQTETTFGRFNRSSFSESGFDLTVLNLETKGDALIARLPDGTLLMIDTGLGEDTFSKLSDFLKRNYVTSKPALRLVITHSHKDHIGGLRKIANEGFEIQEMLIGRSVKDGNAVDQLFAPPTKGRKKIDQLSAAMAAGKRTDFKQKKFAGVTHFVKAGVDPLFDGGTRRVSLAGGIESWSLKTISDVQIDVHHVIRAREPNEGGLLVRLGYRGMHWLLADDLDDSAWATVAKNLEEDEIRAGILKWPHHLWLPKEDTRARRYLESLLLSINPHTILFSNTGHSSHDEARYKEIKKFVVGLLPGVHTEWTREFGKHLVSQAMLDQSH